MNLMKRLLAYLFIVFGLGLIINTSLYSITLAAGKWKVVYKLYPTGPTFSGSSPKRNFADAEAYQKCQGANTHGNASLSLVMTDEHKSISYGIQWQDGIVKVFIQPEGKTLKKWRKGKDWTERQNTLEALKKIFESKWPENNIKLNREGKFRSITVMEKELFADISDMPGKLIQLLNTLSDNPPEIK